MLDPEMLCVSFIFTTIVWTVVGYIVARDAQNRGSSAVLWFILVFFFGLIALIVWLIVRPRETLADLYLRYQAELYRERGYRPPPLRVYGHQPPRYPPY